MSQSTLREQLEAAYDLHDTGDDAPNTDKVVEALNEPAVKIEPIDAETSEAKAERLRDGQGKFTKTESAVNQADSVPQVDKPDEPAPIQRPTTWKKDYLPIWDKLSAGQPLNPDEARKLAEYSNQRENEYKSGVSSYKAEAENARTLQDAISPFLPELKQHNINPTEWIRNLGNAHRTLAMGTSEQKLQMFQNLAHSYGIPLSAVQQHQDGQLDPAIVSLMNEINQLKNGVSEFSGWRQQQEQQAIQQEISKFQDAAKYPHFEMVRSNMARILQSGEATDLQTAYDLAAKPIEDLIEQRLSQVSAHQPDPVAAAAAAKAKAISPKSSTPRGQVAKPAAKDLRSQIESAYDQHMNARV